MKHNDRLDDCVKNLIHHVGFRQFLTLTHIEINHHLITTLVERWRTETHTFHLPLGEATIKLEDVVVQLNLPIDGEPITGINSGNLVPLCNHLLGSMPPETEYKGNNIKLYWLNNEFQDLPHDADDVMVAQHARAHILTLIESLLMSDTSGSRVHLMYLLLLSDLDNVSNYSLGSDVLACHYRALDHGVDFNQENIGGCTLLLQCWVWDHITCLSPPVQRLSDVANGLGLPLVKR